MRDVAEVIEAPRWSLASAAHTIAGRRKTPLHWEATLNPDKQSVLRSSREYERVKKEAFLEKYSSGRPPRAHYLFHDGELYPLKAVWAAAHKPPIHTREFQTAEARRGLKALKFKTFVEGEVAEQFEEGERIVREAKMLARNPRLVAQAKAHYGAVCRVCRFDFETHYGSIGAGYIECHHIDPLSGRDGRNAPTKIEDVTVLCANCHRMVHRKKPALTLDELTSALNRVSD